MVCGLQSKADAFEYADQVLERWYPTLEEGNNKGIVVLVTSQKEGAVTGGPEFIKSVGDTVLDAVVSQNLPVIGDISAIGPLVRYRYLYNGDISVIGPLVRYRYLYYRRYITDIPDIMLAVDEKYNEAIYSSATRLAAAIDGLPDPGGPQPKDAKRESNFKTKEETAEKRDQFTVVVGGLLVIAFVVPMAQYYAYVSKK
ncbi:putative Acid phosphatase [Helianthus annuus]|nr:putative Acid phosphatase [Helianthus annuus]